MKKGLTTGVVAVAFLLLAYGGGAKAQGPLRAQQAAPTSGVEGKIDLNTASAAALAALPGMGAAYARRVVEGRPYSAKNQLATRGVLPQDAYERIKDRVVAHRAGRTGE